MKSDLTERPCTSEDRYLDTVSREDDGRGDRLPACYARSFSELITTVEYERRAELR